MRCSIKEKKIAFHNFHHLWLVAIYTRDLRLIKLLSLHIVQHCNYSDTILSKLGQAEKIVRVLLSLTRKEETSTAKGKRAKIHSAHVKVEAW